MKRILLAAILFCSATAANATAPTPAGCTSPEKRGWYIAVPVDDGSDAAMQRDVRLFSYEYTMKGLGEPSLRCGDVPAQAYRFTWDPSFWPTVSVRAWKDAQGTAWVSATSLQLMNAPDAKGPPERSTCPATRTLKPAEWARIEAVFNALQSTPEADPGMGGLDGESWDLESSVDGQQRLLTRWQPEEPAVRRAGAVMMRLGGCQIHRKL
jgi:hypothetical protein